jgi:hypothetical protein
LHPRVVDTAHAVAGERAADERMIRGAAVDALSAATFSRPSGLGLALGARRTTSASAARMPMTRKAT